MIDKNFYLENLSAFDILIEDDDHKQAEEVIFRVYSILQRDKIWLSDVATEEEIFEEDAELLEEVEEELKELDLKYNFRFDDFYKLVQQEINKSPDNAVVNSDQDEVFNSEIFDENEDDNSGEFDEDDNLDYEEENDGLYDDEDDDNLSHLSDEEIDQVTEYILESAKTRFDYAQFLKSFPVSEESFIDEQFLFPLIAGKAHEETDLEIAENMLSAFTTVGIQLDTNTVITIVEKIGKDIDLEILAFKIAVDSLQRGAHPQDVVHQISQLLKS